MRTYSLPTLIAWHTFAAVLACLSSVAQAQLSGFPEFLEKHFRVDATDAQDGPKLSSQFDYTADHALITRNSVKFNNDGFEDQMAVGLAQNFGTANARVMYNLQRYKYTSWESQTEDVTLDIHYRALRLQRRFETTAQVSTIGLPFDVSVVHLDLSYSQTRQVDSPDPIDVYRLVSRLKGLTFSASLQDSGGESWVDFSTEYRPSRNWLMKYTYTNHGPDSERQFRSEYVAKDYRLTGEYNAQSYAGDQTHSAGAIGIETDTKLAALKLRLEYDDYVDIPAVSIFLKVESHFVF